MITSRSLLDGRQGEDGGDCKPHGDYRRGDDISDVYTQ